VLLFSCAALPFFVPSTPRCVDWYPAEEAVRAPGSPGRGTNTPPSEQTVCQSVSSRSVSLDDSKRPGVQCAVQCSQCAYVQAVSVRGVSVCAMSVRAVSVCAVRVRACSEYARSVHPTVSAHAVNRSESSVLSVQRCCARAVSAVVRLCNGVCSHKCSAVSAVRAHSESVCIVSQCSA
jgi:hypothetical protein